MKTQLTAQYVRSILDYNADSGIFTWRHRPERNKSWNSRYAGKRAGNFSDQYVQIDIDGITHKAHQIAWLLATGNWPTAAIDHRDTNKSNNKIQNLRLATSSQNSSNAVIYSNNTSGVKGLTWRKNRNCWCARITVRYKVIVIGHFHSKSEAISALENARHKYHGEFARSA